MRFLQGFLPQRNPQPVLVESSATSLLESPDQSPAFPLDLDERLQLARSAMADRDLVLAKEHLEFILERRPTSLAALVCLRWVNRKLGSVKSQNAL